MLVDDHDTSDRFEGKRYIVGGVVEPMPSEELAIWRTLDVYEARCIDVRVLLLKCLDLRQDVPGSVVDESDLHIDDEQGTAKVIHWQGPISAP